MKLNMKISNSMFNINVDDNQQLFGDDLESFHTNCIDPMTFLLYQNANEKFKSSFLGKLFTDSFFDKSHGQSRFESGLTVYGFLIQFYFKASDINVGDHFIYNFVSHFSEISDLNNIVFCLEVKFSDSDMKKIDEHKIFMDVQKEALDQCWQLSDIYSIEELKKIVSSKKHPTWCDSFRDKIFNYIYEVHPVILAENIDISAYKSKVYELDSLIDKFITVFDMETF